MLLTPEGAPGAVAGAVPAVPSGTWFALMLPLGTLPPRLLLPWVVPAGAVPPVVLPPGVVAPCVVLPGLVVAPIGALIVPTELPDWLAPPEGVLLGPDMVPGVRPSVRPPGALGCGATLGEVVSDERAVPVAPPWTGVAAGLLAPLGEVDCAGMLAWGLGMAEGGVPAAGVPGEDCAKAAELSNAIVKAETMVLVLGVRIGKFPLMPVLMVRALGNERRG
jgi:hypothetical protein